MVLQLVVVILSWFSLLVWSAEPELTISLPSQEKKNSLIRDAVLHLMEGVYAKTQLPALAQDKLVLPEGNLPKSFLEAMADNPQPLPAETIYGSFKRSHAQFKKMAETYRARTLELKHADFLVPSTLAELLEKTGFADPQKGWERTIVEKSTVKGLTRVLYRSPKDQPRVSIAQTHLSENGDLSAKVRETELIVRRTDSKQWDFYVYDEEGKLGVESTFLVGKNKDAVVGPVPLLCFTCHYDTDAHLFTRDHFVK